MNAQSRAIEDILRRENIPYKIVGGLKFYERKEIKDIIKQKNILIVMLKLNKKNLGIML